MYKHILLRIPIVFTFLMALPTSLLILLPVLYFGNKNQDLFLSQNDKFSVHIIFEAIGFLGLSMFAFNEDNE